MFKYLIALMVLIVGTVALIFFKIGVPQVYKQEFPVLNQPHFYGSPDQRFSDIKIAAFYFVPKDKALKTAPNWEDLLAESLQKLQQFHDLQLQGRSTVTFEIYPAPIIGLETTQNYNTDVTQHGNPEALRRVAVELENRVFDPVGDLFLPDFAKAKPNQYRVIVILYEGVGASGSDNVALVSSIFLTDPEYRQYGSSILVHEFYHTLGIPDGYDLLTAIPTTQDLMGLGRLRPVEKTYLERETIRKLGL